MADNSELKKIIQAGIREKGFIPFDEFMSLALNHPEHGYYIRKNPIGRKGDFTTSPEVSQLFGDIIGAWCMYVWMETGKPSPFYLVEAGPGNGTLMEDIMRTAKLIPAFREAVNIRLIECNNVLKTVQAEKLAEFADRTKWLSSVNEIPDAPFIMIANEFPDALPVKQFLHEGEVWKERVVSLNKSDEFIFSSHDIDEDTAALLPTADVPKRAVYEYSSAVAATVKTVAEKVAKNKGYALFIDYGYDTPPTPFRDTVQSLFKHKYSPVLKNVGEQDITAHVDFGLIRRTAEENGCNATHVTKQSDFLKLLGVEVRAELLAKNAKNDRQRLTIRAGLQRLVSPDAMGKLFKVVALYPNNCPEPEGFLSNEDL